LFLVTLLGFGLCAGCQVYGEHNQSKRSKEIIAEQRARKAHWEKLMAEKYGKDWRGNP
jgi:hypothetical protein